MTTTPLIRMQGPATDPRIGDYHSAGAWRALSWFGFVLAFVGLTDVVLVFYPSRLGDPAWEFGVLATAVSTLPLLVVGVAALLGSAMARQKRAQARLTATFAILLGIALLAGYVIYLTTVPIALKMAPVEVLAGVQKAIVRTSIMSLAFSLAFIGGGIVAIRASRRSRTAR